MRSRRVWGVNKGGNVAADLTDFPYTIREMSDVSEEKTINVTFVGVDENLYRVTVDLNGQWLNEVGGGREGLRCGADGH